MRHCEICKKPVEAGRLTLPKTRLCVEHAKKVRVYGGEFNTVATVKSTSKTNSLKANYTDVSTELVRNPEAIEKARWDYEDEQYG